jgi:hypothetical protein
MWSVGVLISGTQTAAVSHVALISLKYLKVDIVLPWSYYLNLYLHCAIPKRAAGLDFDWRFVASDGNDTCDAMSVAYEVYFQQNTILTILLCTEIKFFLSKSPQNTICYGNDQPHGFKLAFVF